MFCTLARIWKKAKVLAMRAVVAVGERLGRLWKSHGTRVTRDPGYAAATVVVLGGLFGVVPLMEVLAAVLAAALGVYMTTRHGPGRGGDRWSDDWDLA